MLALLSSTFLSAAMPPAALNAGHMIRASCKIPIKNSMKEMAYKRM